MRSAQLLTSGPSVSLMVGTSFSGRAMATAQPVASTTTTGTSASAAVAIRHSSANTCAPSTPPRTRCRRAASRCGAYRNNWNFTMRALVFNGELSLTERPTPKRQDESLVRVRLAGICNTDIEITRGYNAYHGILGHEFVGVAESGPYKGQRVVGEINASCGQCVMCMSGNRTHCPQRTVLGIHERDGAMAEYLTLPHENLYVVPECIQDEQAVFVEPLAAAFEILDGVHVRPSERVVVIGDGKLGQLCVQVLA